MNQYLKLATILYRWLFFCLILVLPLIAFAKHRKPVWRGYTATVDGRLGVSTLGIKGANSKCNAIFNASHACSYSEIIGLGPNYPYSSDAWVIDGSESRHSGSGTRQITKDGRSGDATNTPNKPMCAGWTGNLGTQMGPYMNTAGYLLLSACSGPSYAVPCCNTGNGAILSWDQPTMCVASGDGVATLTNTGAGPSGTLTISQTGGAGWILDNCTGNSLGPGTSCTITVLGTSSNGSTIKVNGGAPTIAVSNAPSC